MWWSRYRLRSRRLHLNDHSNTLIDLAAPLDQQHKHDLFFGDFEDDSPAADARTAQSTLVHQFYLYPRIDRSLGHSFLPSFHARLRVTVLTAQFALDPS